MQALGLWTSLVIVLHLVTGVLWERKTTLGRLWGKSTMKCLFIACYVGKFLFSRLQLVPKIVSLHSLKICCSSYLVVTMKRVCTVLWSSIAVFLIYRKYTFKSKSSAALYVDSDSDDEPLKRSVANSQRLCNIQCRDQQPLQEEPEKVREGKKKVQTSVCVGAVCACGLPVFFLA